MTNFRRGIVSISRRAAHGGLLPPEGCFLPLEASFLPPEGSFLSPGACFLPGSEN
jgi:hypothetical protein